MRASAKRRSTKARNRNSDLSHFQPNGDRKAEVGQVSISDEITYVPLSRVQPSPQNDRLYKPVNVDDPDFRTYLEQVRINGITDPIIVTLDYFIVSGHRRFAAAKVLGFPNVPCRIAQIYHNDPRFLILLRDCNGQRVKTLDEVVREELVSANPEEAHRLLREHRKRRARVKVDTIALGEAKRRARITDAKRPFLDAIAVILEQYEDSWPLSVRQVHYYLLNSPPLIHAKKPQSRYRNNLKSYKAADELITRARLAGDIPFEAIHDPTRPVVNWAVYSSTAPFIRTELDEFLKGYYRDLMQSQPNHIEIIGEKNTIEGMLRPVAMDYTIPYTIGRGYSSLPPRENMAERFRRSGKEKLVLLVLSDFDPEGEDIGRSFAQSMRDDFGIDAIVPVKVTLTADQVARLGLPPGLTAKKTSSRRKRFVERHGEHVFELEAIPPPTLQQYLRDAIGNVINVAAYNAEVDREAEDAAYLDVVRRQAIAVLGELGRDRE